MESTHRSLGEILWDSNSPTFSLSAHEVLQVLRFWKGYPYELNKCSEAIFAANTDEWTLRERYPGEMTIEAIRFAKEAGLRATEARHRIAVVVTDKSGRERLIPVENCCEDTDTLVIPRVAGLADGYQYVQFDFAGLRRLEVMAEVSELNILVAVWGLMGAHRVAEDILCAQLERRRLDCSSLAESRKVCHLFCYKIKDKLNVLSIWPECAAELSRGRLLRPEDLAIVKGERHYEAVVQADRMFARLRAQLKLELATQSGVGSHVTGVASWQNGNLADVPEPTAPHASADAPKSPSFDVFLSHNSKDKPVVRRLSKAMKARGLRVWLDEWELVPGQSWQEALEQIIKTAKAAAVLFGPAGLGPWEEPEMRACLCEFVKRRLPVIPVLLPGAPKEPELPLFLQEFTWVDLRGGLKKDGLTRLQWGIIVGRSRT
jgi:hypothetical protein